MGLAHGNPTAGKRGIDHHPLRDHPRRPGMERCGNDLQKRLAYTPHLTKIKQFILIKQEQKPQGLLVT